MDHADMERTVPAARLLKADRTQGILQPTDIDGLIPEDDPARAVWAYVGMLDLSSFDEQVGSVEGEAGRPAIDPRILLSIWLLALKEGIGSSRRVAELCERHRSYQWICGGVPVQYRTLSNFRTGNRELVDLLLTKSIAILQHSGLIEVEAIAQDGMKVRASAGRSSFRKPKRLKELLVEARERVRMLREELEADPGSCSRRQEAARMRGRQDREQRLMLAAEQMKKLKERDEREASRSGRNRVQRESKNRSGDDDPDKPSPGAKNRTHEAAVSTTDPEARFMKFPGGGVHPGYNAQFATEGSGVIVGVDVTNSGSDYNQSPSMLDQVKRRTGTMPTTLLADSGYASKKDIEGAAHRGCELFASPREERTDTKRGVRRGRPDTPAVAEWRARMKTEEAAQLVRIRSGVAEPVNSRARKQGFYFVTVRGLEKVRAVLTLSALVQNMQYTWRHLPGFGLAPAPA
jgi:transposase